MLPSGDPTNLSPFRSRAGGWAIALIFFVSLLPMLKWLEFSYGIESIQVATALESKRTGNWLTPTLNEQPRVKKPPFPAWMTGLLLSDRLMSAIEAAPASQNDPAYQELALRVRLPALIASTLTVVLVGEIGLLIGGAAVGFFAACALSGAGLLIHKHARQAIPDVYLMLFVAVSIWGLVRALFADKWDGWLIAGIGLGLGLMCKGPVIGLQTIVPVAIARFLFHSNSPMPDARSRPRWKPVAPIIGGLLMLAIGLWWFGLIVYRNPEALNIWWSEVTRDGALDQKPGKFFIYIMLIPWMHPWTALIVGGIALAIARRDQIRDHPHLRAVVFGLIGAAIPLLLMAIAKDRKERYMLPMVIPAAVMVGGVLVEHVRGLMEKRIIDRALLILTWLLVAMVLLLTPLLGGVLKPDFEGLPQYSRSFALLMVSAGLPLIGLLIWFTMKRPIYAPPLIVVVSLLAAMVFAWGYQFTEEGQSELRPLAEAIRQNYRSANTYFLDRTGDTATSNLAIYLNRCVPEMPRPEQAVTTDVPQIIVIDTPEDVPPPTPAPLWREFWRNRPDRPTRYAFVMEGGGARR